ncbi:MAG: hypothetical protein ACOZE7_14040 [Pseudomonadota bacterium]
MPDPINRPSGPSGPFQIKRYLSAALGTADKVATTTRMSLWKP